MTKFKILSGPDRFALVDSMVFGTPIEFEIQESDEQYRALSNAAKTKQSFIVNGITKESGDGHSWLIQGYQGTLQFQGYYRTHQDSHPRGWMQIDMMSGKYVPASVRAAKAR